MTQGLGNYDFCESNLLMFCLFGPETTNSLTNKYLDGIKTVGILRIIGALSFTVDFADAKSKTQQEGWFECRMHPIGLNVLFLHV